MVMRKIKLNRGKLANLPQLEIGEPAVATDDGSLHIGTEQGNVKLAKDADVQAVSQQLTDTSVKTDWIDIRTLGAPANGVDDDTPAYNEAISILTANGGGEIRFVPGVTYRIGDPNPTPDNTLIVANGAYIKATDGSNGIALKLSGKNAKLIGGIIDGNWDGGTGENRWVKGNGACADDGQSGNQPALQISNTVDAVVENTVFVNSVNDGVNGSYNKNLRLNNCLSKDTAEHGYYFSYSEDVLAYNCETVNNGLNNWGKASVMFKMREGKNYYLYNFKGSNIDPQSKGGFTEGSGEGLYIDGLVANNIDYFIYFTANPTHFGTTNKDIRIRNFRLSGQRRNNFTSFSSISNLSMENGEINGFLMVPLASTSKNILCENCERVNLGGSSQLNMIENVKCRNISSTVNIYGMPGSVLKNIEIDGENAPINNPIYLTGGKVVNLTYRKPVKSSTLDAAFYVRSKDFVLENPVFENISYPLRNHSNNTDPGTVDIVNGVFRNINSVFRDTEGTGMTWRVSNAHLFGVSASVFNTQVSTTVLYSDVLSYDAVSSISAGTGTVTKVEPL